VELVRIQLPRRCADSDHFWLPIIFILGVFVFKGGKDVVMMFLLTEVAPTPINAATYVKHNKNDMGGRLESIGDVLTSLYVLAGSNFFGFGAPSANLELGHQQVDLARSGTHVQ